MTNVEVQCITTGKRKAAPFGLSEILSIQYLRAIAAIGVLSFHAAQHAGGSFGTGAAGVDVFFVMSGFIMWVTSARKPLKPMVYLVRRARRIVPLYWLVTLVVAGIAIGVPHLFPNLTPTVDHILKSLVFYPYRNPEGLIAPLIISGWTLDYEVYFYVIFAFTLLAGFRFRLLVLSALLGFAVLAGQLPHTSNPVWDTYSNSILLEFLAGAWLGRAWTDRLVSNAFIGFIAIIAGLGLLAIVAASGVNIELCRVLLWGLPAFLIVAGAISIDGAGIIPDWPVLEFFGNASYSIYLTHGLALSLIAHILTWAAITSPPILFVVSIAGGLIVGSGCYLIVERPLLHFFHQV
jgi:exopolysaccharide production protein ExoZ